MSSKYREADLNKIRPISIHDRESKVNVESFVDPADVPVVDSAALRATFPDILQGGSLKRVADALIEARDAKREIVWLIGAHVIKCGLSLYLNALAQQGFITSLAATGPRPSTISSWRSSGRPPRTWRLNSLQGGLAWSPRPPRISRRRVWPPRRPVRAWERDWAPTSELRTPQINATASLRAPTARRRRPRYMWRSGPILRTSTLVFPAAAVGELSMRDFRIHTDVVGRVFDRGVVIVFGSAVVLPEVFLKAVSVNYNLGLRPAGVTAAGFDMFQQYRVRENVLTRPFQGAGESYAFSGHHEIMLPLLYQLLQAG